MRIVFFFGLTLLACAIFPPTAQAYIDPGLGSLLLQGLAATAVTALIFWRSLRLKIKNFFSRKKAHSVEDVDDLKRQ